MAATGVQVLCCGRRYQRNDSALAVICLSQAEHPTITHIAAGDAVNIKGDDVIHHPAHLSRAHPLEH